MKSVSTIDDINTIINKLIEINNIINNANEKTKAIFHDGLKDMFGYTAPIPLKYNHVEIRQSSIHGKGLFATEDIPAGVIITYYPVHGVTEDSILEDGTTKGCRFYANDNDTNFIENRKEISRCYGHTIASINNEYLIVGNPNNTSNKLLLAHMINGATGNVFLNIKYDDANNILEFKNIVAKYYITGSKNRNCKIKMDKNKVVACAVTTREIKKNEEIFIFYDPMYWYNITYETDNCDENTGLKNFMTLLNDEDFVLWISKFM